MSLELKRRELISLAAKRESGLFPIKEMEREGGMEGERERVGGREEGREREGGERLWKGGVKKERQDTRQQVEKRCKGDSGITEGSRTRVV